MYESANKARMMVVGAATLLATAISLAATLRSESNDLEEKNCKLMKRNEELTAQLNRTEDELIICKRALHNYDDPLAD